MMHCLEGENTRIVESMLTDRLYAAWNRSRYGYTGTCYAHPLTSPSIHTGYQAVPIWRSQQGTTVLCSYVLKNSVESVWHGNEGS